MSFLFFISKTNSYKYFILYASKKHYTYWKITD